MSEQKKRHRGVSSPFAMSAKAMQKAALRCKQSLNNVYLSIGACESIIELHIVLLSCMLSMIVGQHDQFTSIEGESFKH